jgi:hypothetical protein
MACAKHIKTSLLSYYRFKRGFLCVDEASCAGGLSDVLVDTGKDIIDIEVKISKSDLIRGEAKKSKHKLYKICDGKKYSPNKYILCVPEKLKEVAEEWVNDTNKNYGIIIYKAPASGFRFKRLNFENNLTTIKKAKSFNSSYNKGHFEKVINKRLSSALINKYQEDIIKFEFEQRLKKEI